MKNSYLIPILASLFAVSPVNAFTPTPDPNVRGLRLTKELQINTENIERIVTIADEKKGIKQMLDLIKGSRYNEEMWAYLPKKKLWVEIGHGEKIKITKHTSFNLSFDVHGNVTGGKVDDSKSAGYVKNSVDLDTKYFIGLMKSNEDIVCYHIHRLIGLIGEDNKTTQTTQNSENNFVDAMSDYIDYSLMMCLSLDYTRLNQSKPRNISFKFLSTRRIIEYNLTKNGLKHYKKNPDELQKDAVRLGDFDNNSTYKEAKDLSDLCKRLNNNNQNIIVHFYPIKK